MSLSLTLTPTNQASVNVATENDNEENITRIELALARVVVVSSGEIIDSDNELATTDW